MSMMLIDKTKKRRALAAMEELGMNPKFVLVVLKDALKSHDWHHLEANNFTLLANLIFERQAAQADQELYEDDSAHGRFEQHIDACFEHEPTCSIERTEKRSFEATTSNMFKRPKIEELDIVFETTILPDVSCGLDSTSSKHAKLSSLDNATPFNGNLPSGVTKNSRASGSVVQYVQKGNSVHVQSDSDRKLDFNLKGIRSCTILHKPEEKLASSGQKLSRADKLQEEALAGWNLKRDEEKYHLQHERGKSERPSCSIDTIYNPDLCAASCDSEKEISLTSIEENPPALNMIMEIYSGSGDSSESAGHFNSNRLVTSNNFSITTANEVGKQDKEFILEKESKKLDFRNKNQGESFCQLFDEQKENCARQSKDFTFPSVGFVMDEVNCGSFADGTTISKLPTQNVGKKHDTLDVLIAQSSFDNLNVDSTSRHNSFDISRGEESIPIPLAKDVVRKLSSTFYYASKSHIYQNASVKFSLAKVREDECCSSCFGDCLNSPIPCACGKETGGEYAYNADGFLCDWFLRKVIKEKISWEGNLRHYCPSTSACPFGRLKNIKKNEPCKGHLHRSFVKECWTKCGCDKRCGNRVVQRGIRFRLEVFWDPHGKGWGVRTMENIPAGAFVCEYAGEILTVDELEGRERSRSGYLEYSFPLLLDADLGSERVLKNEEPLCLDNTNYGNIARFINHRCYDANMVDIPVLIESFDRHYYHVAYFTNRPVKALEELTWDYQIDFNDKHSLEAFQCLCESRFCRGRDYKHDEFS